MEVHELDEAVGEAVENRPADRRAGSVGASWPARVVGWRAVR